MMIKAAVFDLDHTLFDRYKTLGKVAPMFREKYEITDGITDEFIAENIITADKNFVHHGWREIYEHLVKCNVFVNPPTFEEYTEFVLSCFKKVAVKFDFTNPMLDSLRESGILTGLITNGRHEVQSEKLKMLELTDKFDKVIISGDTPYGKPDKEIFLMMADGLGIDISEMMYVGDHPKLDVDGSRRAGCTAVWVKTTGTWIFPEIEKPEWQVETVAEIPEIIEKTNRG